MMKQVILATVMAFLSCAGHSQAQNTSERDTRIFLLCDVSGGMNSPDEQPRTTDQEIIKLLKQIFQKLEDRDRKASGNKTSKAQEGKPTPQTPLAKAPDLLSVMLMFAQDYIRPWQQEQRAFRDVEAALAQRLALEPLPNDKEVDAAARRLKCILKYRKDNKIDDKVAEFRQALADIRLKREKNDADYQKVKQDFDLVQSLFNLARTRKQRQKYTRQLKQLDEEQRKIQVIRDVLDEQIKGLQIKVFELEDPLLNAQRDLKKIDDQFESQVKLTIRKNWTVGDWPRGLTFLDAFASPSKIHHFNIKDIPIDYNFKPANTQDYQKKAIKDALERQPYRFQYKQGTGAFRVGPDADFGSADVEQKVGPSSLPDGIRFSHVVPAAKQADGSSTGWKSVVIFLPDGSTNNNVAVIFTNGKNGYVAVIITNRKNDK
jgi:hypothetical protein